MYPPSISPEEILALPLAAFPGKIVLVDTPGEAVERAASFLAQEQVIGFDTETRPTFSPGQRSAGTDLLQLSTGDTAFLFRVKKTGLPASLTALLSSPATLKVGAATRDDVRGLQRIAPFSPSGFVDLQKIAIQYGIHDMAVKKLAAIILGVKISKAQQLSNWAAERLSPAQQSYAATDAWVCRQMYLSLLESQPE